MRKLFIWLLTILLLGCSAKEEDITYILENTGNHNFTREYSTIPTAKVKNWWTRENAEELYNDPCILSDLDIYYLFTPIPFCYVSDYEKFGRDYWQTYNETVNDPTEDCDGWAIYCFMDLYYAGVSEEQLCIVQMKRVDENGDIRRHLATIIYLDPNANEDEFYTILNSGILVHGDYLINKFVFEYGFNLHEYWTYKYERRN